MTEQKYIEKINHLEAVLAMKEKVVDECISMLSDCFNEVDFLEKKVTLLEKRLAAAEQQNVKITSSNSNLPPSKDLQKEKRTNNRKKSGKKKVDNLDIKGIL